AMHTSLVEAVEESDLGGAARIDRLERNDYFVVPLQHILHVGCLLHRCRVADGQHERDTGTDRDFIGRRGEHASGSCWVGHPSLLFSAGAIVSTPEDLAKFIQSLFDGKIVSKESLDQMKTMRDGEGFGMVTFPFAGKTFYGHTGGADNYGAWVAYLPEEKLAVAYTTNAKIYPVKDIVSGVVDIYYNKPFQIPTFESVAVSTEVLDKYVGVYSLPDAPAKFTITRQGATLYAQPPGAQNPVALEATAQDKFKIDNGTPTGIVIEFDAVKNQMTIKRNGGERIFTKEK
ncbi:MAG: beta-lactamase family protein, partial [Flavobacterium sp.]|nr:beta-lactamase family protein [Flavobacterium sp.]